MRLRLRLSVALGLALAGCSGVDLPDAGTHTSPADEGSAPASTGSPASADFSDDHAGSASSWDLVGPPRPQRQRPINRKAIPWVELNYPSVDKYCDPVLAGASIAADAFDEIAITTMPCQVPGVYRMLLHAVPGARFLPGIKTSPYLDRYARLDEPRLWQEVAECVIAACEATGNARCILENEGALRPVWSEEYEIDHERLAEGLRHLPADIEIIWYPAILGNTREQPNTLELSHDVCRTVAAAVPRVSFVDLSFQTKTVPPLPPLTPIRAQIRADLRRLGNTIPILYFYGRLTAESQDYAPEELPALLADDGPLDGEFFVYPGFANWEATMCQASALLG